MISSRCNAQIPLKGIKRNLARGLGKRKIATCQSLISRSSRRLACKRVVYREVCCNLRPYPGIHVATRASETEGGLGEISLLC